MEQIMEHAGNELRWMPSPNGAGFELRDKETPIGLILEEGRFLSNAVGKCADGSWKFAREGMLKSNITVKEANTDVGLALFKKNALNRNGEIQIQKKKFLTVNSNFTMTEYSIKKEKELFLAIRNITRFPNMTAAVTIDPTAVRAPELPWMVLLSWYLAVMQQFDAAANSAAF
jgi:hypothetical protein